MRVQVTDAQRNAANLRHDDPDLAAVQDVLAYYNTKAYYSRQCAQDLAILIKRARNGNGSRQGAG